MSRSTRGGGWWWWRRRRSKTVVESVGRAAGEMSTTGVRARAMALDEEVRGLNGAIVKPCMAWYSGVVWRHDRRPRAEKVKLAGCQAWDASASHPAPVLVPGFLACLN